MSNNKTNIPDELVKTINQLHYYLNKTNNLLQIAHGEAEALRRAYDEGRASLTDDEIDCLTIDLDNFPGKVFPDPFLTLMQVPGWDPKLGLEYSPDAEQAKAAQAIFNQDQDQDKE